MRRLSLIVYLDMDIQQLTGHYLASSCTPPLVLIPVLKHIKSAFIVHRDVISAGDKRHSITYRIGPWGLRTTGLSRDNDLVDGEDGSHGLCRQFDRPGLGGHQIQDTGVLGIQSTSTVLVLFAIYQWSA